MVTVRDERRYVTFEGFTQGIQEYLRGHFPNAETLRRQKQNRRAFLRYNRGRRHHAPLFWTVADLGRWFPRRFPQLPPHTADEFVERLRRVALQTAPLEPTRRSQAGRPTVRHTNRGTTQ